SDGEHVVHSIGEMQLHGVAQVLWDFREVFLVVTRKDCLKDAGPVCGQQLLFESADGQHFAAQGDLAGHGNVAAHGNSAQCAGYGCGHSDAGGRTVFGDRALRNVNVNVDVAVEIARQPEAIRARADI